MPAGGKVDCAGWDISTNSGARRPNVPLDDQVRVAWNPEFLREGHAVDDTLHPDRLVIGTSSESDAAILREVYAPLTEAGVPLVEVDLATAELAKASANAFLAMKISFINAMAEVCEASGADVKLLATVLSYDERIGGRFLNAGLGFGGGCLPKDIRAFMARRRARRRPGADLPQGGRCHQHATPATNGRPGPTARRRLVPRLHRRRSRLRLQA